ncbi:MULTISPECIES: hypothetical protein [unclassified Nocardia]|uniref:hypothetical protein n=1 Tax=Nocardia sp. NPDC019255 TaxID=3154591 RepID=UPI00340E9A6D
MSTRASTSPNLTDHGRTASILRFTTELIAWIATPLALADHSLVLAVAALVLLIGLPTLFATPGDKKQVLIPVPGVVTIGLVVLQLVAAVLASWATWPAWPAVVVTTLTVITTITELPRWRWLLGASAHPAGR